MGMNEVHRDEESQGDAQIYAGMSTVSKGKTSRIYGYGLGFFLIMPALSILTAGFSDPAVSILVSATA